MTALAVAAAVAAIVSALFVGQQVREMRHQTTQQREIAESASQPYVWVDIRIQTINGWLLELVLGNSGKAVATDVTVSIDPPLPTIDKPEAKYVGVMQTKLEAGLASLTPGHQFSWLIGSSPDLMNREGNTAHHITINCVGPFGPVPTNEYVIDFAHFREAVARHSGSLRDVAKSIDKATKRLPDGGRPLEVRLISDD